MTLLRVHLNFKKFKTKIQSSSSNAHADGKKLCSTQNISGASQQTHVVAFSRTTIVEGNLWATSLWKP